MAHMYEDCTMKTFPGVLELRPELQLKATSNRMVTQLVQ